MFCFSSLPVWQTVFFLWNGAFVSVKMSTAVGSHRGLIETNLEVQTPSFCAFFFILWNGMLNSSWQIFPTQINSNFVLKKIILCSWKWLYGSIHRILIRTLSVSHCTLEKLKLQFQACSCDRLLPVIDLFTTLGKTSFFLAVGWA